jgi:hypothetical protein
MSLTLLPPKTLQWPALLLRLLFRKRFPLSAMLPLSRMQWSVATNLPMGALSCKEILHVQFAPNLNNVKD